MILLGHTKWKPMEQRVGIQAFAKKIGKKIKPYTIISTTFLDISK